MGWAGNYQPNQRVCVLVGNPAQWTDATVVAVTDSATLQIVSVREANRKTYLVGNPDGIHQGPCPKAASPRPLPRVQVTIGNRIFSGTTTRAFQNGNMEFELERGLGTVRIDFTKLG